MLGYILKSTTYYILWQKFKKQIVTILLSTGLILLILGIYNDLFSVLKVSDKESMLGLLLLKWLLIFVIVGVNIFMLLRVNTKELKESIKKDDKQKKSTAVKTPLTEEEIAQNKQKLLMTTDLIMAKHKK